MRAKPEPYGAMVVPTAKGAPPAWRESAKMVAIMATALKLEYGYISHDPEVRGGEACIGGTRIAVVDVVALQRAGYLPEEMLDHYMRPLTLAQVHAALAYYYR